MKKYNLNTEILQQRKKVPRYSCELGLGAQEVSWLSAAIRAISVENSWEVLI